VATVTPPGPLTLSTSHAAGSLTVSWPAAWTGVDLQVQTNTLQGTNWITIPGADLGHSYTTPYTTGPGAVFFRLQVQ